MMCNISSEQLVFFLDGNVSIEGKKELENHITACPTCRERLQALGELDLSLRELGRWARLQESTYQTVKRSTRQEKTGEGFGWMQIRWAAGLSTFLVAIFLIYTYFSYSNELQVIRFVGNVNLPHLKRLSFNDTCSTDEGFVALRMADGHSQVECGPNTQVIVKGPRELYIEKGVVWNEVAPDPSKPYRVMTPFGNITVLGTKFEVEVGKSKAGVRVSQGTVELRSNRSSAADSPTKITSGFAGELSDKIKPSPAPVDINKIAKWRLMYQTEIKTSDIAKTVRKMKP